MSVDMAVTAALCMLIPAVMRGGGPRMLAPVLTCIGLFQGPLIPSLQVSQSDALLDVDSSSTWRIFCCWCWNCMICQAEK
jgi:hypothetical protein